MPAQARSLRGRGRRALRPLLVVLALAALAAAPSGARADEPAVEASRIVEGRAAYTRGLAAVDEARWSDALREFERAYELARVPSALFNVGTTLRALGRHRDARDVLARLLRDHALDDATRAEVEQVRAEEAARVARVEVTGLPTGVAVALRVDGRVIDVGAGGSVVVELDAGAHAFEASADGHVTARWDGDLTDGEARTLPLTLVPVELPPPPPPPEPSIAESPWLWVSIASVLALGVGVGVALWAVDDAQLDPTAGRVGIRL